MPIHPAPPVDLAGKVEGLRQGLQAVIDLGHGCSESDFDLPTACPGWTVRDQLSHIAAVEAFLEGEPHVEQDLSGLDHLHNDFAVWMEHGVQARRGRAGAEIVTELERLLPQRLATLSDPALTLETEVASPAGATVPLRRLLSLRLMDIWTHEQDLREALGRPGNLDTAGAAVFVNTVVRAFPGLVAERVPLAEGEAVILESSGPVTARTGVRMVAGDDGGLTGHPLFTGETDPGDNTVRVLKAGPTTSISLSTDALTRRAAGRRTTAETNYRVTGDEARAAAVLDAITITP